MSKIIGVTLKSCKQKLFSFYYDKAFKLFIGIYVSRFLIGSLQVQRKVTGSEFVGVYLTLMSLNYRMRNIQVLPRATDLWKRYES